MWKTALTKMPAVFSPLNLKKGEEHQLRGHVLNLRFSEGLLAARVKGNPNQIYNVHLDLKKWPEQASQCGCSEQKNCEHAVACLLALNARERNETPNFLVNRQDISVQEEIIDAKDLEWFSSVKGGESDFFSYELGIIINQEAVSIVPLVADLIRRWDLKTIESLSDNLLLKLPLGPLKTLKIELGRIKPLLRLLFQFSFSKEHPTDYLKIKRYQMLLMLEVEQALTASATRWQGTEELREKLQELKQLRSLPGAPIPIGLKAQLRDYQQQGFNWLQHLRSCGFGGVLADDMGLGKTIQTLALLQAEKEAGRLSRACLIVAPTSLVSNWFDEAKRFTPGLKVLIFHGSTRHQDEFDGYDLVVSTYGLIQRDKSRFLDYQFYYLILDEAQLIKNSRTKTTQIIQQIRAEHRLCLTGTPLENHLGELWSLFHFLMPGFLSDLKRFRQHYQTPIERHADVEKRSHLAHRIEPFMLRRTKNEVVKELPAKTETTLRIDLAGPQRDLYEAIRMTMEQKVRDAIAKLGMGRSRIVFLDALLKLRQICCDPRLLKLKEAEMSHGHSAKLVALMELIDNLMEEGRKVLIFSQFTSMLELIQAEITQRNYSFLKLTGQSQNRAALVRDFQAGKASIFLISLKAGGIGLNLTEADTVIHYDLWWNPAAEDQATDRSHRIGQKNPVFVYKLITNGTVEEAILQMQEKKRLLVKGLFETSNATNLELTDDDIAQFFMPLS